MFNHEPKDYSCPFCNFLGGKVTDYNNPEDIVYKNKSVTAFIAPTEWFNNMGHVLVVPDTHYENIYDVPDEEIAEVYKAVKKIAMPSARHMTVTAHLHANTTSLLATKTCGIFMSMYILGTKVTTYI